MTRSDHDVTDAQPFEQSTRLARQLDDWLGRASAVAVTAQAIDINDALRRLADRNHAPGFRVAFVGEFNRGKSTLINRLLGRPQLLPTGDVPTTAIVATVQAGSPEHLDVVFTDGSREWRPLEPQSWTDLVADDTAHPDEQQPGATAHVIIENAWLRELDAELLDTPGAGDLTQERVAIVYDVLAQTDAAVFLVSALLPFSMTERAFLEHQVLGRHISRVLVVVSQLDKVAEEERADVMRSVRARVGQVAPQVAIVSSQPAARGESEAKALADVRAMIDSLAASSDRVVWRSRQIAEQLLDRLDDLISVGETALEAATLGAEQRAEAIRQRRNAALTADVRWNQISTQLDQRALHLEGWLRQRIGDESGRLTRLLDDDLRAAPDPAAWFDKRFSYLLSRELIQIGQANEAALLGQVNDDIDWLRAEVAREMNRTIATRRMDSVNVPQPSANAPRGTRMRDLRRIRLLSRLGLGAASIVLFFFVAPISVVATAGAALISEQLINAEERRQREIIRQHMATLVAEAIDRYAVEVAARVRRVYAQLSDELRQEQQSWARSAETVLTRNDSANEQQMWSRAIADASQLRDEVIAALAE